MAHDSNLPCDGDGICMACKERPAEAETLTCKTCVTPWHVTCLSNSAKPQTLNDTAQWDCPDCSLISSDNPSVPPPALSGGSRDLIASIRAIEADVSLTEQDKAMLRQELLSGKANSTLHGDNNKVNELLHLLDESFNCSFCMQLPDRPVTTPCGHNFCLKCFERWVGQGKRSCAKCRDAIPPSMAKQPRINSSLVTAIRMAKMARSNASMSGGLPKVYHYIHNQNRPDKAFTTERAKKSGKANACSGKIFVTIPKDYFGPITAEYDPERNRGVLVGDSWEDRMECRQWGAHFPHVSGIAGQSEYGAQSVALSGGYLDDEDHGEWFLYTGSGGRDLSGNKRTNKEQSFDQKFDKGNESLRISCRKGYPIRVVRSFKEKRSSYAPVEGVRYDGIYRVEKCWRKVGIQGHKVCRYLFVRCDNEPAPWTSDEHGDQPRSLPKVKELDDAIDVTERKGSPAWDYDEIKALWIWKKPQPTSRKQFDGDCGDDDDDETKKSVRRQKQRASVKNKLLKEFSCLICRKVMVLPLTTPCAHNFCKACLESTFAGQSYVRQRTCEGRRTLRAQKNIMKCPSCKNDITDFLQNPQVNREMMNVIERLQRGIEEENAVNLYVADGTVANHQDLHEETNGTVSDADATEEANDEAEERDIIAGVKQNSDFCATALEEDKDGKGSPVKSLNITKPENEEEKKATIGANVCSKLSDQKPGLEIANTGLLDTKEEKVIVPVNEVKITTKRRANDTTDLSTLGAGVQTRKKQAKSGAK